MPLPKRSTSSHPAKGYTSAQSGDLVSTRLPARVKGKDLFDSRLWNDPESTTLFYKFTASLRKTIREDVKKTTSTHRFLRLLRDRKKLVRCYTQNIDCLEAREGLSVDLQQGKGSRQRFSKKAMTQPLLPQDDAVNGGFERGCEVVQLHGDLDTLRCTLCQQLQPCTQEHQRRFLNGTAPLCATCSQTNEDRQNRGKRSTKIGTLRPNIVLYGESHPEADALGSITTHDLSLSPDVLLILGTSLRVKGLKTLIREFAKAVHARPAGKGKVIFVNLSKPPPSVWTDVLDYWVTMDCDAWVRATKSRRRDLWHVQDVLKMPVKKNLGFSHKNAISKDDGDKENVQRIANQKSELRPQVVLPATPRKALQDMNDNSQTKKNSNSVIENHSMGNGTSLSTAAKGLPTGSPSISPLHSESFLTESGTRKRKRTLTENYIDLTESPQKRKKAAVAIWED